MGRLILMFKDTILSTYPLTEEQCITIGRHQSNDIIIDNLAVSGYHARIDAEDGVFMVNDLQSKNGTYINNERVVKTALKQKDRICIGKHNLMVDLLDEIDVSTAMADGRSQGAGTGIFSDEQTMVLDTSLGRHLRGEAPAAEAESEDTIAESYVRDHDSLVFQDSLVFIEGGAGDLDLTQQQRTIGNSPDCDIVVSGFWAFLVGSPAATITKQAGDYLLRYVSGFIKPKRNGGSVKGTIKLRHDDIIELGPIKLQVKLSQGTSR